ncbi:MAG: U32 family peptidase, partial [Cyanobacteria bacterium J06627_15]
NVANPITAAYFVETYGLARLTASYDLNVGQLVALLSTAPSEWFEVTVHQHMPMFHMEHCVFCAFLSAGTDFTNCGRPCEKHDVKLRDRTGIEHVLTADAGCRNTVYNGTAQTGAESIHMLMHHGARRFRVEFLNESPQQVTQTIDCYQQLLRGKLTGKQLWQRLKLQNQLGVTRGTLERKSASRSK